MLDALKGWKHIVAARAYMLGGVAVAFYDIADQVSKANNIDMFGLLPTSWRGFAIIATGVLIESARRNLTPPGDAK